MASKVTTGGNFLDALKTANELQSLHGMEITKENIPFYSNFVKLEKTPQEATVRARMEAAKKGQPFKESTRVDDAPDKGLMAARKLMQDIIEDRLNKHARRS